MQELTVKKLLLENLALLTGRVVVALSYENDAGVWGEDAQPSLCKAGVGISQGQEGLKAAV